MFCCPACYKQMIFFHERSITPSNLASVGSWEIPIVNHRRDVPVAELTERLGCICDLKEVKGTC